MIKRIKINKCSDSITNKFKRNPKYQHKTIKMQMKQIKKKNNKNKYHLKSRLFAHL